jgi:signal transduction histidine kinase
MTQSQAPVSGEERFRRLIDVGRVLVAELDLEVVLERVLDAARALTGARYAAVGVLDERRRELERFLTVGIDEETHHAIGELPRGRGVLGVLIADPRPLRLDDVGHHPRSYGFPPGHPPMHSFLGVPVIVRGEVFGNLYLTEKEGGGEFDEQDEETAVVLADWAAIAIGNARAYSLVEGRRDELERAVATSAATTEIARALAGETDLEHVLELIVKRARALTDARSTIVLLERGEGLEVVAVAGELDRSLVGERLAIDSTVSGDVFRSGRAERFSNASSRIRFALPKEARVESGLFVPLLLRRRVLGVLGAFDRLRDGPEFSRHDEDLLSGFAASAAAAVVNAQDAAAQALRRSVAAAEKERRRWARELHDETLQELAGLKLLLAPLRAVDDPRQREAALQEAADRIDAAVGALRRLITDLRPAALDDYGLGAALEALAARAARTSGLEIALDVQLPGGSGPGGERLAPEVEETLYRVAQEALSNVAKHAGVTAARVAVRERSGTVELVVRDEGAGFDPGRDFDGFGLLGMRERVALVGGTIEIESSPGGGTVVTLTVPVARTPAARVAMRNASR